MTGKDTAKKLISQTIKPLFMKTILLILFFAIAMHGISFAKTLSFDDIDIGEGTELQDIKLNTKMHVASSNNFINTVFFNQITNIYEILDSATNNVKRWPCLDINMHQGYDDYWTDFIVKATTNNFESICYCFVSFYDTSIAFTNSLNLMNKYCHAECLDFDGEYGFGPGCYFTDSQRENTLAVNFKTNTVESIYAALVDSEHSVDASVMLTPSHKLYNYKKSGHFELTDPIPLTEETTKAWMREDNRHLQWRYLRIKLIHNDQGKLTIIPEKTENGSDMWRIIQPYWYNMKYDPMYIFENITQ